MSKYNFVPPKPAAPRNRPPEARAPPPPCSGPAFSRRVIIDFDAVINVAMYTLQIHLLNNTAINLVNTTNELFLHLLWCLFSSQWVASLKRCSVTTLLFCYKPPFYNCFLVVYNKIKMFSFNVKVYHKVNRLHIIN